MSSIRISASTAAILNADAPNAPPVASARALVPAAVTVAPAPVAAAPAPVAVAPAQFRSFQLLLSPSNELA